MVVSIIDTTILYCQFSTTFKKLIIYNKKVCFKWFLFSWLDVQFNRLDHIFRTQDSIKLFLG